MFKKAETTSYLIQTRHQAFLSVHQTRSLYPEVEILEGSECHGHNLCQNTLESLFKKILLV